MEQLNITDGVRRNADENMIRFFIEMGEKRLESSFEQSYRTTNVAYLILSGLVALIGIFACLFEKTSDTHLEVSILALVILSLTVAITMLFTVLGEHIQEYPGRNPSAIDLDKYVSYYTRHEESMYKNAMLDELSDIGRKINVNIAVNNIRTKWLGRCINFQIGGMAVIVVVTAISYFF